MERREDRFFFCFFIRLFFSSPLRPNVGGGREEGDGVVLAGVFPVK